MHYEFKPVSIDKNQHGTLQKSKDNKITVEFYNNQQGRPNVTFEVIIEDYKETDDVLFFDGNSFWLDSLHCDIKQLRLVRPYVEFASSTGAIGVDGSPGLITEDHGGGGSTSFGKPAKEDFK